MESLEVSYPHFFTATDEMIGAWDERIGIWLVDAPSEMLAVRSAACLLFVLLLFVLLLLLLWL